MLSTIQFRIFLSSSPILKTVEIKAYKSQIYLLLYVAGIWSKPERRMHVGLSVGKQDAEENTCI